MYSYDRSESKDVCDIDRILEPAEVVLQEDLESLRRTYSEEERIEFWNMIRSAYKNFILKCSTKLPRDIVKIIKGRYRLAMLLLAASFKLNGEDQESIIKMFKPEEYQLLLDFEEFKIFDNIDVDTIVEFIKRREGRVYELVKKYYERQYNALDEHWGPLMGDLIRAIEERYKARRKKIEEAVVRYVRRYGLIETVSEIEETIKKILETGEFKKKLENELRKKILEEYRIDEMKEKIALLEEERQKLLNTLRQIEDSAVSSISEIKSLAVELEKARQEKERLMKKYEEVATRLSLVERELEDARKKLREKEEELNKLIEKYRDNAGAVEALNAEAETLRSLVSKLTSEVEEYRRMLNAVNQQKQFLEERLNEVEAALRGEIEGRLITSEEAAALAEAYLRRISYKASPPKGGVTIHDPRNDKKIIVKEWDERTIYTSSTDSPVKTKGLILVKKKGLVFKKRNIVLETIVKLHDEPYSAKNYDTKPVTLAEVVELLEKKIHEVEEENYYKILVIASPTGFTKKAIEYVAGEDLYKTFVSKNITLYLVDLITGEVYMNKADPVAINNAYIVKPELPEETIKKVMDYVISEDAVIKAAALSPAEPMILASDIADATGIRDPVVIRTALMRLEKNGWGRVIYVKDRDITAFKYSSKALALIASQNKII
ncbi:MAG: hypothetical protein J7L82_06180 [Staphylothermus sp.]|nr:hypothetical protein [Staphylothermus sp.]